MGIYFSTTTSLAAGTTDTRIISSMIHIGQSTN